MKCNEALWMPRRSSFTAVALVPRTDVAASLSRFRISNFYTRSTNRKKDAITSGYAFDIFHASFDSILTYLLLTKIYRYEAIFALHISQGKINLIFCIRHFRTKKISDLYHILIFFCMISCF
jgi:hypothetical protein